MAKKNKPEDGDGEKPRKKKGKAGKPAEPQIGRTMVSEKEWSHVQAMKVKAAEAAALWREYEAVREEAAAVKKRAQQLDAEVRRMLNDGPTSEFDEEAEELTAAEKIIKQAVQGLLWPEAAETPETVDEADAWRTAPLRESLRKKGNVPLARALNALTKAQILTVGELEDLRATKGADWWEAVLGVSRDGADEVENALIDWLTKHRNAEASDTAAKMADDKHQADSGQALAAGMLPWKRGVVAHLQAAGQYDGDITAAKLKKSLTNVMHTDPDGTAYRGDGKGIIVEKFQGQPLPPKSRIPYAEVAQIIAELRAEGGAPGTAAENAGEVEPAGAKSDGWQRVLVKELIDRFTIVRVMSADDFQGRVAAAGGQIKTNGYQHLSWATLVDGIEVTGFGGESNTQMLPYVEAAKIQKALLKGNPSGGGRAA
jgi:hypothetical protein